MRAKGGHSEQLFSYRPMTRYVSVFVKCDTIFRLFIWKLLQFHTSNFRKLVRQHTESMDGSIIWVLLEIYLAFQQWKNFENPLRIDKVIAMSLVYYFFGTWMLFKNTACALFTALSILWYFNTALGSYITFHCTDIA